MKLSMLYEGRTREDIMRELRNQLTLDSDSDILEIAFDDMEGEGFYERSMGAEGKGSLGGAFEDAMNYESKGREYGQGKALSGVAGRHGFIQYLVTSKGIILYTGHGDEAKKAKSLGFALAH